MACCINFTLQLAGNPNYYQVNNPASSGTYNGAPYWEFDFDLDTCFVLYLEITESSCRWVFAKSKCGQGVDPVPPQSNELGYFDKECNECPFGRYQILSDELVYLEIVECNQECIPLENRTKKSYNSIKLPSTFEEEDRGI